MTSPLLEAPAEIVLNTVPSSKAVVPVPVLFPQSAKNTGVQSPLPTVGVIDGVGVTLAFLVGVGVIVGVTEGVVVGETLLVIDGVILGVTDGVRVTDGVTEAVTLGVTEGVTLGVTL